MADGLQELESFLARSGALLHSGRESVVGISINPERSLTNYKLIEEAVHV